MDDLKAVGVDDVHLRPLCARDNFPVVLDGDAVSLETQGGNHGGEHDRRGEVIEGVGLAVEVNG